MFGPASCGKLQAAAATAASGTELFNVAAKVAAIVENAANHW